MSNGIEKVSCTVLPLAHNVYLCNGQPCNLGFGTFKLAAIDSLRKKLEFPPQNFFKDCCFTSPHRNQFIGVLALLMNQILSGITNISFYSTSFLFMQAGFDTRGSAFATIAVACLQFLFTLLGVSTRENPL